MREKIVPMMVFLLGTGLFGCASPLRTSHLGVPVENFGGVLANNFGGVGTFIVFGPTRGVGLSSPVQGELTVNSGFDFVLTDIDYVLRAGPAAVCNPADKGRRIELTLAVNIGGAAVRNYLLHGRLDDACEFAGRDYMTTGFVVGAGEDLSGGATCVNCVGAPIAVLQLRGYVVARPSS